MGEELTPGQQAAVEAVAKIIAWKMGTVAAGEWVTIVADVIAALRDAGWRDAEQAAKDEAHRDRLSRRCIEYHEDAEDLRARLEADRHAHARLFEQRDEAITERDRLREVADAASDYELAWNEYSRVSRMTTQAGDAAEVLLAKGNAHQRLLDAIRAYDAREETRTDG